MPKPISVSTSGVRCAGAALGNRLLRLPRTASFGIRLLHKVTKDELLSSVASQSTIEDGGGDAMKTKTLFGGEELVFRISR